MRDVLVLIMLAVFLSFQAAPSGTVTVRVDPLLCGRVSALVISLKHNPVISTAIPWAQDRCTGAETILAPGTYHLALQSDFGELVGRDVVVSAGLRNNIDIVMPEVVLEAEVQVNGHAWNGAEVILTDETTGRATIMRTSASGRFALSVSKPGLVHVSVGHTGWMVLSHSAGSFYLDRGFNRKRMSLDSGTLSLVLNTPAEQTKVFISGRGKQVRGAVSSGTIEFYVPYGEYRVFSMRGFDVSDEVSASVSPGAPDSRLELVAEPSSSTVRVTGRSGPTDGVVIGAGAIAQRLSSGLYSLNTMPPQANLKVAAPGYSPQCLTVSRDASHLVALATGREVEITFPKGFTVNRSGSFVALPGSSCNVPLTWFNYRLETPNSIRVLNFPDVPSVSWSQEGLTTTGSVKPIGVVEHGAQFPGLFRLRSS